MALKIVSGSEPVTVKNVKILLYGEPGAGKTSLGFSAKNPLLLDFDHRTYTARNRRDAVELNTWSDALELTPAILKNYDTVIVDTVGRALDMITLHLIEGDSKMATRNGALTLQGYGELKATFTNWMKFLTNINKDVVLIAHNREDKDGDNKIVRPDISGGSYSEAMKTVDFAGYLYMGDKKQRLLNFSPTSSSVGKNSANLDILTVPDLHTEPDWFGDVIDTMKRGLGGINAEYTKITGLLDEWRSTISDLETVGEINNIYKEVKTIGKPLSLQLWSLLKSRADALGLHYDKEAGSFVSETAQQPEQQEQTTETTTKTARKKAA